MPIVKIKIQVYQDNEIAFGPGKAQLLEAIHTHGSIAAAAKSMNMSYKRAWDLVSVMNTSFKAPLVATAVGGTKGGGTILTEAGHNALQTYLTIQSKADQFITTEMASFIPLLAAESTTD